MQRPGHNFLLGVVLKWSWGNVVYLYFAVVTFFYSRQPSKTNLHQNTLKQTKPPLSFIGKLQVIVYSPITPLGCTLSWKVYFLGWETAEFNPRRDHSQKVISVQNDAFEAFIFILAGQMAPNRFLRSPWGVPTVGSWLMTCHMMTKLVQSHRRSEGPWINSLLFRARQKNSGTSVQRRLCFCPPKFYLQARLTWRGARLLRPALQFFLVLLAIYTGLTRISDYRHHPSDVLAGYVQGALTAYWVVSRLNHHRCDTAERAG